MKNALQKFKDLSEKKSNNAEDNIFKYVPKKGLSKVDYYQRKYLKRILA